MQTIVSMQSVLFHLTIIGLFAFAKVVAECNVSVWGPGLRPDIITLPARYFYIQILDINEKSYTTDINTSLQVDISGQTKYGSCRIWVSKLDRKDGSFIVRYKLYEICLTFEIKILYKGQHVASSPYLFKEPIIPDNCYCPQPNITHWMINNGCPNKYDQVLVDLQPFPEVNMKEFSKKIIERFNKPNSVSMCHYVIKNNEIHRKCYGQHVGFKMFSDAILLSLTRKVRLPNTEFFMNLGDWPLVAKKTEILPIFSWCGSTESHDIVIPTYDITESTLENMGRVMLDMLSVQGNIEKPWAKKVQKAFWRGRDSREERLKLIDIARHYPHLYNASLTNFFFFRDREDKYGPKQPAMSFFKFFDYKYQINIDGTVAAYRFPYLLAGDSLVLKQDSPYYEHFYSLLKPNVHYVPFKRDLSDLTDKIKWAIDNDDKAREIATNGRNFARNNLMLQDIICYHAALLFEWSQRLVSRVSILEGMEHVTQAEESLSCECPLSKLVRYKDEL